MSAALRLYRLMTATLPRKIRQRDGEEIIQTFADQLQDSSKSKGAIWRAFTRFPVLFIAEWHDHLTAQKFPRTTKDRPMEIVRRLLSQATRSVLRAPAFSLGVILLLGLGVGSVSAIFAVVDHVLLRQLPYPSADRMFFMDNGSHSMPTFRDMQAMRTVEQWSGVSTNQANLTGEREPTRVAQATVTDGFFAMFGAKPVIGRLLSAEDTNSPDHVVLSANTWRTVFGGDRSILGRTIRIDDHALQVVGVLDAGFAPPEILMDGKVDIWRIVDPTRPEMSNRNYWAFAVAGKLKAGVTLEDAQREANLFAAERAKAFPDVYVYDGKPATLPLVDLHEATIRDVRNALKVLLAAVTLLLIVACANVTHLFLARAISRVQEMSIRRSLGANTRSLAAQLFAESFILGIAGAVAGVIFAQFALRAFLSLIPSGLPRADAIHIDGGVLLFAGSIALLTAIAFGMLPAVQFARGGIASPIRGGSRNVTAGRSAQRMRNVVVVMEVALSLVLVAQAGWLMRSYFRLTHEQLGFRTKDIVTIPMSVPGMKDPAEWYRRMDAVRAQLAATPGVEGAAFGLTMPLEYTGGSRCCWRQPPEFNGKKSKTSSMLHPVSDGYFQLLDLHILAGAPWSTTRALSEPYPAVVTEALAREHFGDAKSAIGQKFNLGAGPDKKIAYEIVGVAADNKHYGASTDAGTGIYVPAERVPFPPDASTLAVRTSSHDKELASRLRQAIWRVEPSVPVPTVRSLDDWAALSSSRQRFESTLFALLGGITLLLVAAGLAGTLFYMVSLQRRDMGIRLALGATSGRIERAVLSRGLTLAGTGAIIGAVAAWASGKIVEARLYGVEARDVSTLGMCVAVLMGVAFLSSWVPARRAAATNPMESLRAE